MRRSTKLQTVKPVRVPALDASEQANVVPWDDARVRHILGPMAEVHAFGGRGLIFAMDATASRQPTWDRGIEVQASMFSAFAPGLKVQLAYFRGAEFHASRWSRKPAELAAEMRRVACVAGTTQIARVLSHACAVAGKGEVSALVYVGDCMEERKEELAALARKLGTLRVAVFMFQEGDDPAAAASFREIAGLTKGAYCRLGEQSAAQLKELLTAAAAYASGGRSALAQLAQQRPAARLLLTQIK